MRGLGATPATKRQQPQTLLQDAPFSRMLARTLQGVLARRDRLASWAAAAQWPQEEKKMGVGKQQQVRVGQRAGDIYEQALAEMDDETRAWFHSVVGCVEVGFTVADLDEYLDEG